MKRNHQPWIFFMTKRHAFLWLITLVLCSSHVHGETKVTPKPFPFEGRHARATTDAGGNVHLIFKRDGNVYYTRKQAHETSFSNPMRVNSIDNCAAVADIAVGSNGRVHVLYHGNIFYVRDNIQSENRKLKPQDIRYTFYSRMNDQGDGFEDQRNVSGQVWGFDGGCSLAADLEGNLYLFFAGTTGSMKEQDRRVYLAHSSDQGQTFSDPKPIDMGKGVCACCHLKASVNRQGELRLAYRAAEAGVDRDSFVLTSRDSGQTFEATPLDRWKLRACPGSVYSLAENENKTFVSWRNQHEIYFTALGESESLSPPDKGAKRRAAVLSTNAKGEMLIAWSEGDNFNISHHLGWQLYGAEGKRIGSRGMVEEALERWGVPCVYPDSDGNFVIFH
jgi:hypothetical protein